MQRNIHLERLLELVSSEDVILFAGSGLSKYAGYPMGAQLQKIFYDSLSPSAKEDIESTRSLADLTDEIFHLHQSNNQIIRILKEYYTKAPLLTSTHDRIAAIPHFKTIITTNYDGLFEGAYNQNSEVLYNNSHVSLADPKKTHIYKIHGDLADSNSIIIKKTDYTNFFNHNSQNSIFWNAIRDKMASNSILFIGYSLEDINIDFIFTDILKQLGEDKKEVFFVAPSLTQSKKNKLGSYGINYIEGTGEELFPLILEHINENIILDLKNNKVSTDTTHKFTKKLGYNITIGSNTASKFFIEKIEKVDGVLNQKIHFATKNNEEFTNKLKGFIEGKTTERNFRIPKTELLDFVMNVDNFKFQDLSELEFLYIMKLPSYEGKIDILFEDGISVLDFNIKVYKDVVQNKVVLSFETDVAAGSITFMPITKGTNINYESEIYKVIEKPRVLLDYYKSFAKIMQGTRFSFLVDGQSVFSKKLRVDKIPEDLEFYINYLEKLCKVETLHLTRFKNISRSDINDSNFYILESIIAKAENTLIELPFQPMRAILDENFDNTILNINKEKHLIFFGENFKTIVNVHGKEFNLGYMRSYVFDPFISNMKAIKYKTAKEIIINNKSGKKKVGFYDVYEVPGEIK